MYSSVEEGSYALLKDVATVLQGFPTIEYMVIGGWCPVLRNKTSIKHPGTLDVDLLFKDSYQSGAIREVIRALLNVGFCASAKHPFQLLKSQKINNEELIFNVDLLHPNMATEKEFLGMFVDHLDLDVPLSKPGKELKSIKSIVLPNSRILFSEALYSKGEIDCVEFPLISYDGMFISKMDSCQKQKRERDSFDIYLGFLGGEVNMEKIERLADKDERIRVSLGTFRGFLKKNRDTFNKNVQMFSHIYDGSPAGFILERLNG